MSVTIKEIAQLCGVSRGTVDRVLNKRGNVNPETAKRVEELALSLGYSPNKAAAALAARKKNIMIGVLVISEGNVFFEDILCGIQRATDEFQTYGITVRVETMKGYHLDTQLSLIDNLLLQGVNGLVITPINDPLVAHKLSSLTDAGIPVVTLNSDIENTNRLCYIGIDYFQSGQIAGGLLGLLSNHSSHVGVVTGSLKSWGHRNRINGFKNILETRYPQLTLVDIVENNDDDIESFSVTKELLIHHPKINSLYLTAGGVYGACRAIQALQLEEKVSIICCDDIPKTRELIETGLIFATICQQPIKQGYQSVKVLFDYIVHNITPDTAHLVIKNEIKIRENLY